MHSLFQAFNFSNISFSHEILVSAPVLTSSVFELIVTRLGHGSWDFGTKGFGPGLDKNCDIYLI